MADSKEIKSKLSSTASTDLSKSPQPPEVVQGTTISGSGRQVASHLTLEEERQIRNEIGMPAYLAALERVGVPWLASRVSGIKQMTVRKWQAEDAEFAACCEEIEQARVDNAEAELYRRGVEGWEEPVGWYKGEAGGYVRRHSDTALIAFLKANRPDKYRENVNLSGGMMQGFIDFSKLSNEQLERIRAGENALAVLGMEALKQKALPAEIIVDDTDSD
jgi:hypothetical protein